MNKIKFAGVAAAALLAITPATTTTLAASNNVEPVGTSKAVGAIDWSNAFNGLKDFFNNIIQEVQKNNQQNNQQNNQTAKTPKEKAVGVVNNFKDVTFDDNHPDTLSTKALSEQLNQNLDPSTFAFYAANIGLTPSSPNPDIVSGDGLTYTTTMPGYKGDDAYKIINAFQNGSGAQIKLLITVKDNETGKILTSKNITYTNNTKTVQTTSNLKIDYKTPIYVPVGSKTVDMTLSSSAISNTTIENNQGQNVAFIAMNPGEFYATPENARNYAHELNLGPKFLKDGATYYQPVKIGFDSDKFNIYDIAYGSMTTQDVVFTLNGQNVKWEQINQDHSNNTVTYVREIKVGQEPTKPDDNNNNQNNNGNKDDNQKPTNPADPVGVWKTEDHNGIVAVGSHVADLVDEDSSYTTRSLAPHTKWQTNATRVNTVTGAKQYRVSTNEWVSAEDVNFQDAAPQFFNNVLQYPGYQTVHLAGPNGFIYALFNQDGVRLDRALQGDSAWATDERATDFDGNIYYRVSTNEWVKTGNGVSVN